MSWLFSRALVAEFSEDICSDGEPCAQSSGAHTQLVFSSQDRTTEFSRRSLSGMTFRLLTEDRGKELLMSYLAGFLVKTSQSLEKAQASTENDQGCGVTWHASLTRYDRDTSSWKTPQRSLLGDSEEFSETWPRWGMMRGGVCWAQSTPVRHTSENESGSSLPTPTATSYGRNKSLGKNAKVRPSLEAMARKNMWPTPTAQDAKNNGAASQHERNTKPLNAEVGGPLNPMFVEWIMGWPLGWTDSKPLEMDKFRRWRRSHGVDSRRQGDRCDERNGEAKQTDEDHNNP